MEISFNPRLLEVREGWTYVSIFYYWRDAEIGQKAISGWALGKGDRTCMGVGKGDLYFDGCPIAFTCCFLCHWMVSTAFEQSGMQ